MKQKTLLISIAACVVLVSGFFSTGVVYGQYGLEETAGAAGLKQYGTDLPTIVGNIVGTGLSMISVLFFGLMIYGGIRWMIARGKEEEAKKALDTIVAAVIGIIIVLASYAITNFVLKSVSGGQVINTGGGGGAGSGGKPKDTDYCFDKATEQCITFSKVKEKEPGADGCPNGTVSFASESECNASVGQSGSCKAKAFFEENGVCNNFLQELKKNIAKDMTEEDKAATKQDEPTCNNMGSLPYAPAEVKDLNCKWDGGNCVSEKAVEAKSICPNLKLESECKQQADICLWQ
ncbi:MAG: hypothetical protein HYY51_02385 [Candidatus Magasanikbacteria bacterium]|nr:hypothetical protein [Candidatus Magasanikbacteria bacterium]